MPLTICGTENLKPIRYYEKRGSAQCKSSIIFAGMRTKGKTIIKAKKSRNHTELMCKYLNLPVKVNIKKNYVYKMLGIMSFERNFLLNIKNLAASTFSKNESK